MNPFARFPFMRYVFPFILGIVIEIYFRVPPTICFVLLLLCALIIFAYSYISRLRSKYGYRYFFGAAMQLFWLGFGMGLTSVSDETGRSHYFENITDKKFLIVKLQEPLSHKARSYKALGQVISVIHDHETSVASGSLVLYFLNESDGIRDLYCGDEILIKANEQDIPATKNPGEFDFRQFLAYQNIHKQVFIRNAEWRLWKTGSSLLIIRNVYRVRDQLLGILNSYIDDKTERGVAGALLFGYKDALDNDVVNAYARTGTLHVLAVSGMHVAILYLVVSFLFKPLRKKKAGAWMSAVVTIALIWFYSLLSGMSPSIVRASVMFTIIVTGKVLRDDISIYNNLFCSACLILCYNPYFLFDAGFQLSYLAVLGIVYFQPKIAQVMIFKSWIGKQIWGLITVSVAAQIATFPISLFYFNQFPNFFILSNLVIIPITSLVMYAGIALIAVCKIPLLASLLGYGINKLIAFADFLIFKIQSLPFAVTEGLYITKAEAFLLYLFMALAALYFMEARKIYLRLAALVFLLFVLNSGLRKYNNSNQSLAVLNSIKGSFSLNIIEGESNQLFCDSNASDAGIKIKSHFKGFWNARGVSNAYIENAKMHYQSARIKFSDRYLLTPSASFYFINGDTRLSQSAQASVDYIVLGKKAEIGLEELAYHFKFRRLVFDGAMKERRKNKYIQEAQRLHLNYYDLVNEGAILVEN